jgi:hypothetical protein
MESPSGKVGSERKKHSSSNWSSSTPTPMTRGHTTSSMLEGLRKQVQNASFCHLDDNLSLEHYCKYCKFGLLKPMGSIDNSTYCTVLIGPSNWSNGQHSFSSNIQHNLNKKNCMRHRNIWFWSTQWANLYTFTGSRPNRKIALVVMCSPSKNRGCWHWHRQIRMFCFLLLELTTVTND